jgi:Domain of unknown function (DUF4129)
VKTTLSFSLLPVRLNPRRELRFALLAAMETCWVYALLAYLASFSGAQRAVSALALFASYWIALVVGRVLPRRKERWIVLQLAAIGVALVVLFVIARIELYSNADLFDFSWVPRYLVLLLSFTSGIAAADLAAIGVLYVFIRGLGFAQRPLTLWFIGFQFRLGIVVFFVLLLIAGFVKPFDQTQWLFMYFFISLLAIALARIDEMESDVRFGPRWIVTLLASVGIVLFLGLVLLQFLTLDNTHLLLLLLSPLWAAVVLIITLVAIPLGILMAWLVDLFSPIFGRISRVFQVLQNLIPTDTGNNLNNAQGLELLKTLLPVAKTLLVLAVVLLIGYLIAKALNRRIKQAEDDAYQRESLNESERRAQRAGAPTKKPRPRRAGYLSAESIRRIYAALVARASEAGLPRATTETPYEYLPRLQRAWPEQADQVRAITDAYVEVHYGEREFGGAEVDRLRAVWQQVEQRIKRKA